MTDKPTWNVKTRLNSKIKYTHISTIDTRTVGWKSCFVIIKQDSGPHPQNWGFHIVRVMLEGRERSTTMATRVVLGKHKIVAFGQAFLDTFTLVLERTTGVENILGETSKLLEHPGKNEKWAGQDIVEAILMTTYDKMWDMDIKAVPFHEIPADIIRDLQFICVGELGDGTGKRLGG